MAIDQKNISASLRIMDDRELQQYAAMHKNDPYIFPLVFQESQNRKALNANKAAQMGGQKMPKVNDAALMAMAPTAAPEDMGIGRLAAPNIERMADGGIAGYDEYDEGMAEGGQIPRYQGMPIAEGGFGSLVNEFEGVDDQIAANLERQKLLGAFDDYSRYTPTPKKGSKAAKQAEEAVKKVEPVKTEPVKRTPLATYTPKTVEEISAASDTMSKAEREEIQKSYKPFAEQFAQDRARIEGREKNAISDMLIRGGLRAMAGKSQFALQNIAEGGLEGLNAYQEGIKTNEASRRALTQSEMLMGQAQRAEERGARTEARGLYALADKAQQAGVQLGQEARKIEGTEAFQEGSLAVSRQNALTQERMADASMVSALASRDRANALNAAGGSGDKHMAALTKVQTVLNNDPDYKEAAKMAKYAGPMGDAARAMMDAKKREVYRLFAPELLESLDAGKTAPLAGSGGGSNLPPISSFYTKPK